MGTSCSSNHLAVIGNRGLDNEYANWTDVNIPWCFPPDHRHRVSFAPNWRLPGDMSFSFGNVEFYFPLATSLILSIILTIGVNLLIGFARRQ